MLGRRAMARPEPGKKQRGKVAEDLDFDDVKSVSIDLETMQGVEKTRRGKIEGAVKKGRRRSMAPSVASTGKSKKSAGTEGNGFATKKEMAGKDDGDDDDHDDDDDDDDALLVALTQSAPATFAGELPRGSVDEGRPRKKSTGKRKKGNVRDVEPDLGQQVAQMAMAKKLGMPSTLLQDIQALRNDKYVVTRTQKEVDVIGESAEETDEAPRDSGPSEPPSIKMLSDAAASLESDQYGDQVTAYYLAQFIRDHARSSANPGTLSVALEAAWGAGKSSLMEMLREELDDNYRKQKSSENNIEDDPLLATEYKLTWRDLDVLIGKIEEENMQKRERLHSRRATAVAASVGFRQASKAGGKSGKWGRRGGGDASELTPMILKDYWDSSDEEDVDLVALAHGQVGMEDVTRITRSATSGLQRVSSFRTRRSRINDHWDTSDGEEEADNDTGASSGAPGFVSCRFDAYKYTSSTSAYAGLLDVVMAELLSRLSPRRRIRFLMQLNARSINAEVVDKQRQLIRSRAIQERIHKVLPIFLACVFVAAAIVYTVQAVLKPAVAVQVATTVSVIVGSILLPAYMFTRDVRRRIQAGMDSLADPEAVCELLARPTYEASVGELARLSRHLAALKHVLRRKDWSCDRVLVMIDDLDRCPPNRVAQVLEGVAAVVAENAEMTFVIGMDSEIVVKALQHAYDGVISMVVHDSQRIALAWAFIEKYVQTPILLPFVSRTPDKFLQSLARAGDTATLPSRDGSVRQSVQEDVESSDDDDDVDDDTDTGDCVVTVGSDGSVRALPAAIEANEDAEQMVGGDPAHTPAAVLEENRTRSLAAPDVAVDLTCDVDAAQMAASPRSFPTLDQEIALAMGETDPVVDNNSDGAVATKQIDSKAAEEGDEEEQAKTRKKKTNTTRKSKTANDEEQEEKELQEKKEKEEKLAKAGGTTGGVANQLGSKELDKVITTLEETSGETFDKAVTEFHLYAKLFISTPRALKIATNVFRFYRRLVHGTRQNITRAHLDRFVVLLVRWPHVARWVRAGVLHPSLTDCRFDGNVVQGRLRLVEHYARTVHALTIAAVNDGSGPATPTIPVPPATAIRMMDRPRSNTASSSSSLYSDASGISGRMTRGNSVVSSERMSASRSIPSTILNVAGADVTIEAETLQVMNDELFVDKDAMLRRFFSPNEADIMCHWRRPEHGFMPVHKPALAKDLDLSEAARSDVVLF